MTRKVVIMSGISGSGKSTYAKNLKEYSAHEAAIVSADNYFMRDGEYKYDASKLVMRMLIASASS